MRYRPSPVSLACFSALVDTLREPTVLALGLSGRQKALKRAEGAELKASFVSSHEEPSDVPSTSLVHLIPEVSLQRRLHRRILWLDG